jgi:chromosome segregation ATPase
MRDDLDNYKKVAQMSKELATYYSPFTPLHQYKREILIKLPMIKSEIIDLKEAMKETSENIDGLKKQIRELEAANREMSAKGEAAVKKNLDLNARMSEMEGQMSEMSKKSFDEVPKLRDKLEKAESQRLIIDKRLIKVEKELKEYQDLAAGQKETIKNLYEQKKEIVYIEATPEKLKQSDLEKFQKKCETLSQACDTLGLIVKEDASVMTDPIQFGGQSGMPS